jgi:2-polyprenyl-3-methyl-5-hydroxy-6-metoxy-1,4-benzoquinol methylase
MKNKYKLNLSKYSTHNLISEAIGRNNKVLDVGCNDGYIGYIGQIADKSNIFYGLDYLPLSIKKAKKIYQDASVYDLNNLKPLPWKTKFSFIVFADVLEHVLDPTEVLLFFVNKYLDKDGKVIISLPNIANWQVRLKLLFGQFNYTETGILDKTQKS